MTMTFMSSPSLLVTSESVTEGHPDKVCDQIADAILDEIIAHDPEAHVACEVVATTGLVLIIGEISTSHYVDCTGIARQVIRDIGYTRPEYAFDAESCGVLVSVKEQSSRDQRRRRRGRRRRRPGHHAWLRLQRDTRT